MTISLSFSRFVPEAGKTIVADSGTPPCRGDDQWRLWTALVEDGDHAYCARFHVPGVIPGGADRVEFFFGLRALLLRSRPLDSRRQLPGRLCFLPRSAFAGHAA